MSLLNKNHTITCTNNVHVPCPLALVQQLLGDL